MLRNRPARGWPGKRRPWLDRLGSVTGSESRALNIQRSSARGRGEEIKSTAVFRGFCPLPWSSER
jgi:hypothetical protein